MMIYYTKLKGVPTRQNAHYESIEGAIIHFYSQAINSDSALSIANYQILRLDWNIVSIDQAPVMINKEPIESEDLMKHIEECRKYGYSMFFVGWPKKGMGQIREFTLERRHKINRENFYKQYNKSKRKPCHNTRY